MFVLLCVIRSKYSYTFYLIIVHSYVVCLCYVKSHYRINPDLENLLIQHSLQQNFISVLHILILFNLLHARLRREKYGYVVLSERDLIHILRKKEKDRVSFRFS